jgi:glycine/D-amino acid oxidase-like deaminating enzyme
MAPAWWARGNPPRFIRDQEARGAMYEPDGIGIHAAKLAFGYLRLARKLGAKVHTASPVLSCRKNGNVYHLNPPNGRSRRGRSVLQLLVTRRPACIR